MEASKVIHAIYTDDDVLMNAVKTVKAEKHHIEEIYTPFPVHGLDKAMGLA
ncbi:MAG: quinol:electron acceptor oxidoreductase subunit ActD, partial [Oceanihabitans sp.]